MNFNKIDISKVDISKLSLALISLSAKMKDGDQYAVLEDGTVFDINVGGIQIGEMKFMVDEWDVVDEEKNEVMLHLVQV